jgi:O-acetyl-ADP-ribose deacetylase (regulator of RNase III)
MVTKRKDFKMIAHLDGDLLQVQKMLNIDVICHQVNCQGVMGSGIAKQIRDTYPQVYDEYKKKCDIAGADKASLLGQAQVIGLDDNYLAGRKVLHVCNLFSQYSYGYDGKRYTSYDAFWSCLGKIRDTVPKGTTIAFPKNIGSCRGGANWNVIKTMIAEALHDYEVYIYELEE